MRIPFLVSLHIGRVWSVIGSLLRYGSSTTAHKINESRASHFCIVYRRIEAKAQFTYTYNEKDCLLLVLNYLMSLGIIFVRKEC